MTIATEHHYIVRDDTILSGEPVIRGTRTPVRAIVEVQGSDLAGSGVKADARYAKSAISPRSRIQFMELTSSKIRAT